MYYYLFKWIKYFLIGKLKKIYSGIINENFFGNYLFVNLKIVFVMGFLGNENEN